MVQQRTPTDANQDLLAASPRGGGPQTNAAHDVAVYREALETLHRQGFALGETNRVQNTSPGSRQEPEVPGMARGSGFEVSVHQANQRVEARLKRLREDG